MFAEDYEALAQANDNFRKVLFTGPHSQVVAMCLRPGEDIGEEVHEDGDQIFLITEGSGEIQIDDEVHIAAEDSLAVVPAGNRHNVTNTSQTDLKFITFYAPPEHPDGTVHKTKPES